MKQRFLTRFVSGAVTLHQELSGIYSEDGGKKGSSKA